MIEVQIHLKINPDRVDEVFELINEDKHNALCASNGVFTEFDVVDSGNNKMYIRAICESMEKLGEHMTQSHYRWKELKDNGAIISQTHRFIEL
jgi:hypothetical protein